MIIKKQRINFIFPLSLLFFIGLWFLTSHMGMLNSLFVPSPGDFYTTFLEMFFKENFLDDMWISTVRVFGAFILAFIIAIPMALLMSQVKWFNDLFEPYIDFIRYLPVPALIPLTILFFGIGEGSKISLLFIGTFFQMILLIIDDINVIPIQYMELAKVLRFSRYKKIMMKLRLIGPQLYDNARITLGWCWTYLVIAELVAAQSGVGHIIKEAQRFSDIPKVYVAIFSLGVIGLIIDLSMKKTKPFFFKYL